MGKIQGVFIAAVLLWAGPANSFADLTAPRPVVVITDIGGDPDDWWALAHVTLSPRLQLVGVIATVIPGVENSNLYTGQNAIRLLSAIKPGRVVPVARGDAAISFLERITRPFSRSRRLTVLLNGPATEVAATLKNDPSLQDRIEIIAMGFENYPGGGDRWNVKADVNAWRTLLDSRVPLTIGSAPVAIRDLSFKKNQLAPFAGDGTVGKLLFEKFTAWVDQDASRETWPLWDEITTAEVLGLAASENVPRPRLDDSLKFVFPAVRRGTIRWTSRVDRAGLMKDLKKLIY